MSLRIVIALKQWDPCLVGSSLHQLQRRKGTSLAQRERDVSSSITLFLPFKFGHQVLWLCTRLVNWEEA